MHLVRDVITIFGDMCNDCIFNLNSIIVHPSVLFNRNGIGF